MSIDMSSFTDRSRKVMALANQEAQRFNHEVVDSHHLLVGMIKEGSGIAWHVLKNLGVDLRAVRVAVEGLVQPGPDAIIMGKLPLTDKSKQIVANAVEEARNLNHSWVGTEHLLLGLLRVPNCLACQVLGEMGLQLVDVHHEVLCLLGHFAEPGARPEAPQGCFAQASSADTSDQEVDQLLNAAPHVAELANQFTIDQLQKALTNVAAFRSRAPEMAEQARKAMIAQVQGHCDLMEAGIRALMAAKGISQGQQTGLPLAQQSMDDGTRTDTVPQQDVINAAEQSWRDAPPML